MIEEPRCFTRRCRHFQGVRQDRMAELTERPVCPAFPDGIPDRIAYGDDLHLQVEPGQALRIVFEAEP